MALRRQVSEARATFSDPLLGVNLRLSEQDLRRGDARLMQNCIFEGGTRIRTGSQRLNTSSFGAFRVRGGHKFYYGGASPTSKRLIAYSTKISHISDAGSETVLNSGMTSDKDTYFTTWPITDKVYISNANDVLRSYDGTTFSTVSGTAIPTPRTGVVPIGDRLLAITSNGIERTNPRVDNVWSSNSAWATFRPARAGLFTALHPVSIKGYDTVYSGAAAFQANAYYVITGSDFGSDVTSATASTGEDSAIQLLDPNIGTSSPYSVETVPGLGIFWFTTDKNVYFVPEGSLTGRYVGDKLQSQVDQAGIESVNNAALAGVWMRYDSFNRRLLLGIPVAGNSFATTQWWLDVRLFIQNELREAVWNGPMTGQSVGVSWLENQNGDNTLMGGEGSSTNGAFVYKLVQPNRFTDAVGATDTSIEMVYQPYFEDFDWPSREKYIRGVHFDLNPFDGSATMDLYDLDGLVASGIPIEVVT